MVRKNSKGSRKIDLARLKRWFGAPPLLGHENQKDFDDYVNKLAECLEPDDHLADVLVYHFAIESWMYMFLVRCKAAILLRQNGVRADFKKHHEANREMRRLEEKNPETIQDIKDENDPEFTSLLVLDLQYDNAQYTVNKSREARDATALEGAIDIFERIDQLITQHFKRQNDALHQLEIYRFALAERIRKKAEVVLASESTRRISPPLIPAMEQDR